MMTNEQTAGIHCFSPQGLIERAHQYLICDDVEKDARQLAGLIGAADAHADIALFAEGGEALRHIRAGGRADLCFLDIVMPGMDGLRLAEEIRAAGYAGEIVFLTASNDYAHQSYRVKAFDYLLKPPTAESVRQILAALEKRQKDADCGGLPVKTQGAARFILFRDISHVEVIGHTVYIRLQDGTEVEVYATLGEIAAQLFRDSRFVQCHRSYIINVSHADTVTDQEVVMQSGARVPISRGFSQVRAVLLKWMFGGSRA